MPPLPRLYVILTAAVDRSTLSSALPSKRSSELLLAPAFSSNRCNETGPAYSLAVKRCRFAGGVRIPLWAFSECVAMHNRMAARVLRLSCATNVRVVQTSVIPRDVVRLGGARPIKSAGARVQSGRAVCPGWSSVDAARATAAGILRKPQERPCQAQALLRPCEVGLCEPGLR